ncbi:MAG: BatA domain-containing protein [Ignavibacteriales bacterium]|nr:BatA domain-containing protein [Ignavibacteriales bacterium]
MVFLNPAILLGLLAASIPIIIHLLNFRKLKKVEFSTLSFLKELQKSKIKNIKIKQWLLLLIRTLIIIFFLVLAFARPTLESVNFIGSTGSAKSSVVFILDNSFSMSYVNDKGSIFNQSKKSYKSCFRKTTRWG